ncbi:restriction endonuclease subunit S [Phocaeicola vulgatus]|jgi:type I restriction enzyme S subunit|nr:restriction endonuclease subunit S [Phocaeicola vulgatus]
MDTKKLRQKILDLAIHGKLVPQDPTDEPASVLLERIKAEKERLIKEGKIKRSKKSAKTSDTPHYENVPFEIPNNWVWTTLGEISNYGDSNNVSVTDIADDEWILELEDLEKDTASIIQILSKKERSIKGVRHKFKKGDVLYSKLRTYLNKVLVAPQIGYCTTEIIPFNSYCGISTHYLCHVLRSAYFLDYTQQCGYGVKMPRLSTNDACKGMIPLPPLAEQHRIVAEIEKWFSLIDIIENGKSDLQTTIKQTKSKILDLAIHGKLISQDLNDEPAIELLKRINPDYTPCDNGHYENLPSGWAMCKLSDLCRIENGFAFSSNDYKTQGIPLVRISNIIHNTIDITDCAYIEGVTDNKFKISKGDLLIAMSGATTGKMGVYPFDETAYLNQRVGNIKILNKSLLSPDYRNTYMQSKVDEILKIAYGGAQPNISASVIGNFDFPLPPYKEQIRIVETVQRIFGQLDVITESL